MSEKNMCSLCGYKFSTSYNLTKHLRKYHAEESVSLIKKKYDYHCRNCKRNFSQLKHYNFHMKTHRNRIASDILSALHRNVECPICKLAAPKEYLIQHFEVEHNIKLLTQTINFISFQKFLTWKTDMERNSKSKYILERGAQYTKDGSKIMKYYCHRSGKFVSRGQGIRSLKTSKKINGFCPASLKLIIKKNNRCQLSFMDQHVGHDENDLGNVYLTTVGRKSLDEKVDLKIHFSQILYDLRDSIDEIITEEDNIKYKINRSLHSGIEEHANDTASVDDSVLSYKPQDEDSLLIEDLNAYEAIEIVTSPAHNEVSLTRDIAKEKQNLIDYFTQMVASLNTMEQVEAVKKIFNSLEPTNDPTMKAKNSKSMLKKLLCSPSKIIKPERAK